MSCTRSTGNGSRLPVMATLCAKKNEDRLMPFTEIELKYIEHTVGKMCKRRSPADLREELRIVYEVTGLDVILYEERPVWHNPKQWSKMGVAKFKYSRKDSKWKLYWMRRDVKWHMYDVGIPGGTKKLEVLVREVDDDPDGAFFG